MNKKQYFIITLLLFSLMQCAKPGVNCKKNYPDLHGKLLGRWFVLSNDVAGKVLSSFSINSDGTVTGELEDFIHNGKTFWSEWVNVDCISSDSRMLDYSHMMRYSKLLKSRKSTANWAIYDNMLSLRYYKLNVYCQEKIIIVDDLINYKDIQINKKYKDHSQYVKIIHVIYNSSNFKGNKVYFAIKDESKLKEIQQSLETRSVKDVKIQDKRNNDLVNIVKAYYQKGRFGGGFREFKWGMTRKECRDMLDKLNIYQIYHENDGIIKTKKKDESESANFYFYEGYLYSVELSIGGITGRFLSPRPNSGIFSPGYDLKENLSKKYGGPGIKKWTESRSSSERGNVGVYLSKYTWSDGITEIYYQLTEGTVLWSDYREENHYIFSPINFDSVIIMNYINKLKQKEQNKKDQSFQGQL